MGEIWASFVGLLTSLINIMYEVTKSIGIPNYGLAIVLFTTILRLLMFPLNLTQAKSSKAVSLLQPRIAKLQQLYKGDVQRINTETQALYKKYNANPLSGCLPMLVQMPILFALFSALRGFEFTGEGAAFLWMPNLSEPDPTGIVLPVIVGLSSYLQTKLTMAAQPPAGDQAKMMNSMMLYGMPVMLGWTTRSFASGLAIYWSVFNILGYLMQIVINVMVKNSLGGLETRIAEDEAQEIENAKKEEARKKREAQRRKEADRLRAEERKRNPQNRNRRNTPGGGSGGSRGSGSGQNKGQALNFDD
ncbi:MAG: YidC/Oxa1 family membrane protein insertase [Clostridiales bacterium]|nr:YidC/Oxa1 family membrane protein insertase [Clostridiales bacterium]